MATAALSSKTQNWSPSNLLFLDARLRCSKFHSPLCECCFGKDKSGIQPERRIISNASSSISRTQKRRPGAAAFVFLVATDTGRIGCPAITHAASPDPEKRRSQSLVFYGRIKFGPGQCPVPLCCCRRDVHHDGCFFDREAAEIAMLDQLPLARILFAKFLKGQV